jgi:hypothetical protein
MGRQASGFKAKVVGGWDFLDRNVRVLRDVQLVSVWLHMHVVVPTTRVTPVLTGWHLRQRPLHHLEPVSAGQIVERGTWKARFLVNKVWGFVPPPGEKDMLDGSEEYFSKALSLTMLPSAHFCSPYSVPRISRIGMRFPPVMTSFVELIDFEFQENVL